MGMAKVEVWGRQRWGCGNGGITQVEIRVCQNIRGKPTFCKLKAAFIGERCHSRATMITKACDYLVLVIRCL